MQGGAIQVIAWLQERRPATVALVATVGLLFVAMPALAQQLVPVPPLQAPVTDLTGTLTPDQVAALDAKLRSFEQAKGSQIAVLIVATTEPEAIEQYALRVAEAWKLGRKGVDDGALLLVALQDRRVAATSGWVSPNAVTWCASAERSSRSASVCLPRWASARPRFE